MIALRAASFTIVYLLKIPRSNCTNALRPLPLAVRLLALILCTKLPFRLIGDAYVQGRCRGGCRAIRLKCGACGHEEDLYAFRNVLRNLVQVLFEAVAHDQVAIVYQMCEVFHRQRTIFDVDARPRGRRDDDA